MNCHFLKYSATNFGLIHYCLFILILIDLTYVLVNEVKIIEKRINSIMYKPNELKKQILKIDNTPGKTEYLHCW